MEGRAKAEGDPKGSGEAMTRRAGAVLAFCAAALSCLRAEHPGLARIEAIADLERRSRESLEFALAEFEAAVTAFGAGDLERGRNALDAVGKAVEMAVDSLQSTGKHPRRHPRHFKRAEIRTRKLLGQMRQAQGKAYLEDQGDFEAAIQRVEKANGILLLGIMSRRD